MNLIPVRSSNLRAVAYEPWSRALVIAFHSGGMYQYDRVPPAEYAGLLRASSHGKYFHARIKDSYPWRKVSR